LLSAKAIFAVVSEVLLIHTKIFIVMHFRVKNDFFENANVVRNTLSKKQINESC
jgi:hypothetical protein